MRNLTHEDLVKIYEIMDECSHLYRVADENITEDEMMLFRSFISLVEYKIWWKSIQFEHKISDLRSSMLDMHGLKALGYAINLDESSYIMKLIDNTIIVPNLKKISFEKLNEMHEILQSCEHIHLIIKEENVKIYNSLLNSNQYYVYEKGFAISSSFNNWVTIDESGIDKFIRNIKLNEFNYQKELKLANISGAVPMNIKSGFKNIL